MDYLIKQFYSIWNSESKLGNGHLTIKIILFDQKRY